MNTTTKHGFDLIRHTLFATKELLQLANNVNNTPQTNVIITSTGETLNALTAAINAVYGIVEAQESEIAELKRHIKNMEIVNNV